MLSFVAVKKESKHAELEDGSVVYAYPDPVPLMLQDPSTDPDKNYMMAPGFHLGLKPDDGDGRERADSDARRKFLKRLTMQQYSSLTAADFRNANINLRCKNGKLHFTIEVNLPTALRILMGPTTPPRANKPNRPAA